MKRILTMIVCSMSVFAVHNAWATESVADNRPAHQKAHDLYIEPTLRATTMKTERYTDVRGHTQQETTEQSVQVFNHQGQIIDQKTTSHTDKYTDKLPATQTIPQAAPVVDKARTAPEQVKPAVHKEITDKSRPLPH